ncbi:MAG: glycosyltransferase [Cyclobacteriaceae bacterium]
MLWVFVVMCCTSIYCYAVAWLWFRMVVPDSREALGPWPSAVVIVPVRNEENHIARLFTQFSSITYPGDWEVWLVDDHSTDQSWPQMQRLATGHPRIRAYQSSGVGKKAAIAEVIAATQSQVIVTTDADCVIDDGWMRSLMATMRDESVRLTAGLVRIAGGSLWNRVQALEFSSVMAMAWITAKGGRPLYCSGANLAIRRSAWEEVGGYGMYGTGTGDDLDLLNRIASLHPGSTRMVRATVDTHGQADAVTFLQQRIRWASKWQRVQGGTALAVVHWIFQVVFLGVLFTAPLGYGSAAACCWFLKVLVDGLFLTRAMSLLGQRFGLAEFLVVEALYAPYVIYVGLQALTGRYVWKGRKYN